MRGWVNARRIKKKEMKWAKLRDLRQDGKFQCTTHSKRKKPLMTFFWETFEELGINLHTIYKTAIVAALLHFITEHHSYEPLVCLDL